MQHQTGISLYRLAKASSELHRIAELARQHCPRASVASASISIARVDPDDPPVILLPIGDADDAELLANVIWGRDGNAVPKETLGYEQVRWRGPIPGSGVTLDLHAPLPREQVSSTIELDDDEIASWDVPR